MCESRFSWHRTNIACTVEADMFSREAIAWGERRLRQRRSTILRLVGSGVRFGQWCGRLDRSCISSGPISR